ncbi:MAG: SprB repeat-containing protein, partial [Saprospiraceae bacterium]
GQEPYNYTVLLGGAQVAAGTINATGASETIAGLAPGVYTVNINSANGFQTNVTAAITQLFPPIISAVAVSNYNGFGVSCDGEDDGAARANVLSGGMQPFSFAWSNGANSQQVNNLTAGSYAVTVTDANNCTAVAQVALSQPAPLRFNFTVTDLDCFGVNNGAITVNASGGVP